VADFVRTVLAEGISAFLPTGWEYTAESTDSIHTSGIEMSNGSCNARFELLNSAGMSGREFIDSYRFALMQGLSQLDVAFLPNNPLRPQELAATKEGVPGQIVHILVDTNPIIHISAIPVSDSDLLEVRLIAESITLDESANVKTSEDLVPMRLLGEWHKQAIEQS